MRISDWSSDVCSSDLVESGPTASVTLTLTSPAGDQGYPGTLDVTVTYSLDRAWALTIDFGAKTDAPTIVNLTNHAIVNLAGEGAARGILDHKLTVTARRYTPEIGRATSELQSLMRISYALFSCEKNRSNREIHS